MSTAVTKLNASFAERLFAFACLTGMSAIAFVVWYFDPVNAGFFPVCPLYKMTGYACPGCGSTRALHALLHGDFLTAVDYNLLLPFLLIFFGYLAVSFVLTLVRGRGLDFKIFNQKIIWGFFIFSMVFTVLRNLPYYPFNLLFP